MLACLTLLCLGVGLGHLFHLYTEKNRDPEKCTAPVIVFYNNTQANLTLDFMYSLKKRTGVVSISGTYYVDNKMSGVIRVMFPMYGVKIKTAPILYRRISTKSRVTKHCPMRLSRRFYPIFMSIQGKVSVTPS